MANDRPILIAGAGVAGLTAAIALARAGFRVALLEQATRFAEVGAGLQLSPNASGVLIGLGLGPAIARNATAPDSILIRRLFGGRVLSQAPMNIGNPFGSPFWSTLRADLQTALIDAARGEANISFLVGRTVKKIEPRANGVVATVATASGGVESLEGAALIGADGLWSAARALLNDDAAPTFTSYEAWRALIPIAAAPESCRRPIVQLWLGRDAHLVHYPVGRGSMINLVLVRPASAPRGETGREVWDAAGDKAALADIAARAAPPARELIRTTDDWKVWSLYDRPGTTRWTKGPVALIGDAAHPILPFLAQGAALAIEDAAVLAQEAQHSPDDLPGAFRRYEARRSKRATQVQQTSRGNGRAYHASGFVAVMRDFAMRRMGDAGVRERYRWLYGWTPSA